MNKFAGIKVTGLPHIGPQELKLNPDDKTYFIMGANGTGKTSILKIINFCLQRDWENLAEMIFSEIMLIFLINDSRKAFYIKNNNNLELLNEDKTLSIPLIINDNIKNISDIEKNRIINDGIREGKLIVLSCGHWKAANIDSDSSLSHMKDVNFVIEYLSRDNPELFEKICKNGNMDGDSNFLREFIELTSNEKIFFISADRNQKVINKDYKNDYINIKDLYDHLIDRVTPDISSLSEKISLMLNKYEDDIQQQQLSFIDDLILNRDIGKEKITIDNANKIYEQYQENMNSLFEIGIHPSKSLSPPTEDNPNLWIIANLIRNFNSSYEKNFSNEIKYFKALFRFLSNAIPTKIFEFSENKILIRPKSNSQAEILPRNLSSGEQQLVILGYEILSSCNSNSLVLIDEPELSMDPAMKAEFVDFLNEASELRNSRYLLATHSHMVVGKKRNEVQILTWEGNAIE